MGLVLPDNLCTYWIPSPVHFSLFAESPRAGRAALVVDCGTPPAAKMASHGGKTTSEWLGPATKRLRDQTFADSFRYTLAQFRQFAPRSTSVVLANRRGTRRRGQIGGFVER